MRGVSDQGFERMIERLMKSDFSAGTDAFREDLLARCLDVLGADDDQCAEVDDSDLEMLAAAGVPGAIGRIGFESGARIGNETNDGSPT